MTNDENNYSHRIEYENFFILIQFTCRFTDYEKNIIKSIFFFSVLPNFFLSGGYYRIIDTLDQIGSVIHQVSVETEPTSTADGWTVEIVVMSM